MKAEEILTYYSTHNVKSTLNKFDITYAELKELCKAAHFVKTSEQIKETYRTTRIEKYGSIEGYRKAKREALYRTNDKLNLIRWANNYNKQKENKNED